MHCTICVAITKALICTADLPLVFAYAYCWFSDVVAHLIMHTFIPSHMQLHHILVRKSSKIFGAIKCLICIFDKMNINERSNSFKCIISFLVYLMISDTVRPHNNTPHYKAVFNITRPCHGSQNDYFAICLL